MRVGVGNYEVATVMHQTVETGRTLVHRVDLEVRSKVSKEILAQVKIEKQLSDLEGLQMSIWIGGEERVVDLVVK